MDDSLRRPEISFPPKLTCFFFLPRIWPFFCHFPRGICIECSGTGFLFFTHQAPWATVSHSSPFHPLLCTPAECAPCHVQTPWSHVCGRKCTISRHCTSQPLLESFTWWLEDAGELLRASPFKSFLCCKCFGHKFHKRCVEVHFVSRLVPEIPAQVFCDQPKIVPLLMMLFGGGGRGSGLPLLGGVFSFREMVFIVLYVICLS